MWMLWRQPAKNRKNTLLQSHWELRQLTGPRWVDFTSLAAKRLPNKPATAQWSPAEKMLMVSSSQTLHGSLSQRLSGISGFLVEFVHGSNSPTVRVLIICPVLLHCDSWVTELESRKIIKTKECYNGLGLNLSCSCYVEFWWFFPAQHPSSIFCKQYLPLP